VAEPNPNGTIAGIAAAAAVGVAAVVAYAAQAEPVLRVGAVGVMTAAAATAAGGLVGFLFGIPRALTSSRPEDTRPGRTRYAGNTNLEQVSDWLTKILVGVGLTQLGSIRAGGGDLVRALAPSLGGGPAAAPFAGTLVAYFLVVGFLGTWLMTRRFLGAALEAADADADALDALRAAKEARAKGDPARADELTEVAERLLTPAGKAADRYNAIRASRRGSPARTLEFERIVDEGRRLGRDPATDPSTIHAIYRRGTEGDRVQVLGILQVRPEFADVSLILPSIEQVESPFEQYHALRVAEAAAGLLNSGDRDRLVAAIEVQRAKGGMIRPGSDRWALSERVLAALANAERESP
jgi:hypothetical protein